MAHCQRHIVPNAGHWRPQTAMPQTRTVIMLVLAGLLFCVAPANAQQSATSIAQITSSQPEQQTGAPLQITLKDAIERARKMSPAVRQAVMNARIAAEKPTESRAVNLPTVSANSQYLYTEGNGTPSARYIANNGVHEYIAQSDVHQSISLANILLYRQSIVEVALSRDQAEIAQRGLVVAVVESYASLVAAQHKYQTQQQSTQAAQAFLKTTQQLEAGGEVAHEDVVKAQIQFDDSQIALQDAQLARETARAALAMMLFADVNQNYEVVEDPAQTLSLSEFAEVEAAARLHNPKLEAAFEGERAASEAVKSARAEYLPTMTLDYFYGIDANHFASTTPSSFRTDPELGGRPIQNLGYSALASVTLPIWDWGKTRSKVKSAEVLQQESVVDLKFAQRRLIADLQQFYDQAKTAKSELEIRRSAAADAEESEKLTLLQYKAGDATALEVVTAEDGLTLERDAFADAETRYATALANLATLTGSL